MELHRLFHLFKAGFGLGLRLHGMCLVLSEKGVVPVDPFQEKIEIVGEFGLDHFDDVDEFELFLYDGFAHIECSLLLYSSETRKYE